MRNLVCLILLLFVVAGGQQVPQADGEQYPVSSWKFWIAWQEIELLDGPNGKVVRKIPQGALMRCSKMLTDKDGHTWLDVAYNGKRYFTRAGARLVLPDQSEPVKPDARGDFHGRNQHTYWMVVDPTGLNGRWHKAIDLHSNAAWPDHKMAEWPVVTNFSTGTILKARHGNLGVVYAETADGKPWLQVWYGPDKACMVRANSLYIRPVDGP